MFYICFATIVFALVMTLKGLFSPSYGKGQRISMDHLYWILLVYVTLLLGFGLLYTLLVLQNGAVLVENGAAIQGTVLQKMMVSFYFSAMTLFSVGFGDITPLGIGRLLASVEAMLGFLLPAGFVVRAVIEHSYRNSN